MKKLINKPEDVLREQLEGMATAHPDLIKVHFDPHFVYRADAPVMGKVAVISGGGSGHEPMHGGYVGKGMLDAACPGEIFTSPTPDQMTEATRKVYGGAGTLFIVKNYTGDVMNFEMAADMLRDEGMNVRNVIIDDDIAVKDSSYTAGRRGVGTTVLAEKIVGAAAEAGYDLKKLAELCHTVNSNGRSMGMALTPCVTPVSGKPSFELAGDEIEIGIGIHGEPGTRRTKIRPADEIIEEMTLAIIEDEAYTRNLREWDPNTGDWIEVTVTDPPFAQGDRVIAFVNGMGGTPLSELYGVYRTVANLCERKGLKIVRNLIGPYITSIEMQGCSITLLKVDDTMLGFWDAPVKTPALRWGI
jgi:phosphoenolpyruvate---glycerone phosphotransferase subunit DhaK